MCSSGPPGAHPYPNQQALAVAESLPTVLDVAPGMTLLLDVSMGGYTAALGYTGDPSHRPTPVPATSFLNTSF